MVDRVQEIEVFGTTSQEKICFPPDGQKNRNSPRVGFLSQLLWIRTKTVCLLTLIRVLA